MLIINTFLLRIYYKLYFIFLIANTYCIIVFPLEKVFIIYYLDLLLSYKIISKIFSLLNKVKRKFL